MPVRSFEEERFATVIRQKYDFSCGSAALATLLRYHYGLSQDEEATFRGMWATGDQPQIRRVGFSLLDMKRYHRLLAGASWMAEYGDPDVPDEWSVIARYSPYQNLKKDAKYPRTLFTTSTRDDRVHPGHARKMVARMMEMGHDLLYYENIEGGHGGAANNEQAAYRSALTFTFLAKQLGLAVK